MESLYLVEIDLDDSFVERVILKKELVLPNLRDLDLSHNSFQNNYPKLMSALQERCHLLTNLSLASCKLSPTVDISLALTFTDPHLPTTPSFLYLKRLDLSTSLCGDDHARQLARSTALRYLEFLKLKHCALGNQAFTELVGSTNLRRLKVLILSKNKLTKLVFPFDDLKTASQLQLRREIMDLAVLDLRGNHLTGTIKQAHKFFKSTVVLAWDNQISAKAVEAVIQKPTMHTKIQTYNTSHQEGPNGGGQAEEVKAEGAGTFNPFIIMQAGEQHRILVD